MHLELTQLLLGVQSMWGDLYMSLIDRSIGFPMLAREIDVESLSNNPKPQSTAKVGSGRDAAFGDAESSAPITLATLLCSESERRLLSGTGALCADWIVGEVDEAWCDAIAAEVKQWQHLALARVNTVKMHKCIELLKPLLAESTKVQNTLKKIDASVSELEGLLTGYDWAGLTLKDTQRFTGTSEAIPPVLVALDLGLATALSASLDLIGWLKTLPDDTDFMSALEMAMGRSEMECPAELWDDGSGASGHGSGAGLGRVSEQKLSWLRNVRSYLHPVIYHNHDLFMSARSVARKIQCQAFNAMLNPRASGPKLTISISATRHHAVTLWPSSNFFRRFRRRWWKTYRSVPA